MPEREHLDWSGEELDPLHKDVCESHVPETRPDDTIYCPRCWMCDECGDRHHPEDACDA